MGNLTHTVSGDIASFRSAARVPIESLKCYFEPIQEGSGDPSPENVRSITGWQGINVYQNNTNSLNGNQTIIPITFPTTGKNLLNTLSNNDTEPLILNTKTVNKGYYSQGKQWLTADNVTNLIISQGNISYTQAGLGAGFGVSYCLYLVPGETYIMSGIATNGNIKYDFFDQNKNHLDYFRFNINNSVTVPDNTYYTYITFAPATNTANQNISFSNLQLELGSTATTYEQYNNDNTIYGGCIDVAKGTISKVQKKITLNGTEDFTDYVTYSNTITFSLKRSAYDATQAGNVYAYMSYLKRDADTTTPWTFWVMAANGRLVIAMPKTYTLATFKQYLSEHPLEFVYSTTNSYKFPPIQLKTLLDQNYIWSNTNSTTEVSYQLHDSNMIQSIKKEIFCGNAPHLESVTGNIVNFNTDLVAPIKNAKICFNPVQEGSGDPSPNNVRSISGWVETEVTRCGKNLFNKDTQIEYAQYNKDGQYELNTTRIMTDYIPIFPGQEYTIKINSDDDRLVFINYNLFDENFNWIGHRMTNNDSNLAGKTEHTFTVNLEASHYLRMVFRDKNDPGVIINNRTLANSQIQLELGSVATSYEPYSDTTFSINWSTEAGELYGGYIDLLNGKLVQTHYKVTFDGTETIYSCYSTANDQFIRIQYMDYQNPKIKKALKNSQQHKDTCKYSHGIYQASNTIDVSKGGVVSNSGGTATLAIIHLPKSIHVSDFINDINTYLQTQYNNGTPVEICYELAEPITYQLSPIQLKTFRGTNNIWSNANGPVEISYWTH